MILISKAEGNMEVAPLRVKDLPEHRSDRGREPDSLSDGFVRLKRESGFGLASVKTCV